MTTATKYGRRACLTVISEEMSLGFLGGEERNLAASLHEPLTRVITRAPRSKRGVQSETKREEEGVVPRPKRSPLFDETVAEWGIAIG